MAPKVGYNRILRAATACWKNLTILVVIAFASTFLSFGHSAGGEIYVDFSAGDDGNTGKNQSSPWKHAPGDKNASAKSAKYILKAGDVVNFKGGVTYFGSIIFPENGEKGAPITYRGNAWGDRKAIISGARNVPVLFQKCPSLQACFNNKNWKNLLIATISGGLNPFSQLHVLGERYWPAQSPNLPDPFWFDDITNYSVVPKGKSQIVLKTNSLSLYKKDFASSKEEWGTPWIAVWMKPNQVIVTEITSLDFTNATVHFANNDRPPYESRKSYYSFFNRPVDVDRPGEYSIVEQQNKILLWPTKNEHAEAEEILVAERPIAFNFNGYSNIVVEGFVMQNFVGHQREWRSGVAFLNVKETSSNISILDNKIQSLRSHEGNGAIELQNTRNIRVERNVIINSQKNSGIRLSKTVNAVVAGNFISQIGRTGIRLIGTEKVRVSGNEISDILGIHGNGISVYLKNKNVLIADNVVRRTPSAFTYHGSRKKGEAKNLWVLNNMFLGRVNSWGKDMSKVHLFHNLFFAPNAPGKALQTPATERDLTVINNIVDGWLVKRYPSNWSVSHNLYSQYSWTQKQSAKTGWSREKGARYDRFLHSNIKYAIKRGKNFSRTRGVLIYKFLPKKIFGDYDFSHWTTRKPIGPKEFTHSPNGITIKQ